MQNGTFDRNNTPPRALQFYNSFRRLGSEHVNWTRAFIISTAFDLPDLEANTVRLLRNPSDFANILRPFYGNVAARRFGQLLTDHLNIIMNIVNAMKAEDFDNEDILRRDLYNNISELSTYLGELNPNWNPTVWSELLNEHLLMLENASALLLRGMYPESITQFDSIQTEALRMGDEMAEGLIRQFGI